MYFNLCPQAQWHLPNKTNLIITQIMLFLFQSKTFMPLMKITQMMFEKKKNFKSQWVNGNTKKKKKKKKVSLKFYMVYGNKYKKSFEKP